MGRGDASLDRRATDLVIAGASPPSTPKDGGTHVTDERVVLRIKADRAKEFERLFKKHQYPNWQKHHAKGGMLAASLTRVEYGVEEEDAKQGGYVTYLVFAKLTGQRAHDAHDNDPDFRAWDEMTEQFQIEGPSVWGGKTIFEIG